jgi:large subunit ribosomal protein L19
MSNLVQKFENEQIDKLTSKKRIPAFRPGDTLKITLKIVEGEKSRLQSYEGLCIARKNNSVNSKFTVRKMSHGEGVEKVFPLFSPNIDKIEVVRKGDVKRAKLYYLRDRTGKSARIADRDRGNEVDQYELIESADQLVESQSDIQASKEAVDKTLVVEEKSESPATDAENTENESKS